MKVVDICKQTAAFLERKPCKNHIQGWCPKTKKGNSPGARIACLEDSKKYKKTIIQTTTLDKYFLSNCL